LPTRAFLSGITVDTDTGRLPALLFDANLFPPGASSQITILWVAVPLDADLKIRAVHVDAGELDACIVEADKALVTLFVRAILRIGRSSL